MKKIQAIFLSIIICFSVTSLFACSTSNTNNTEIKQTCENGYHNFFEEIIS